MWRSTARLLTGLAPRGFLKRASLKLLRESSSEWRAYTGLFVPPYDHWAEWNSGLADAAHVLYALARATRPRCVVEIGSARGRSTCALALACRQNGRGKVYAIDPHSLNPWAEGKAEGETLQFLRARLKEYELEPYVEVIRDTSAGAARGWDREIDLLFIDGDHTYEGVRQDFEAFARWVSPRGVVALHDSLWEYARDKGGYRTDIGVPRYLDELREEGYPSVTLPVFPGLTLLYPRAGGFEFVPREGDAATRELREALS